MGHTLHRDRVHFAWDRDLEPALRVAPGERVEVEVQDASAGVITADSEPRDLEHLDPQRVNPVTGPLWIDGAEPGDALEVEILALAGSGWGWTGLIPGFGLLAEEFPEPFLHISRYDECRVEFLPGLEVPTRPFPGTAGVAPAARGSHPLIPPRREGGNLDCRDLVAGARLQLPVAVPGALFSVGDTHAAQGDGEVCGTAIESPMSLELRFQLHKAAAPRFPRLTVPSGARTWPRETGWIVTTGVGENLEAAARDAVREMIDQLASEHGLSPEHAYCLASVAADLHITEIVNVPHRVVSLRLPTALFG